MFVWAGWRSQQGLKHKMEHSSNGEMNQTGKVGSQLRVQNGHRATTDYNTCCLKQTKYATETNVKQVYESIKQGMCRNNTAQQSRNNIVLLELNITEYNVNSYITTVTHKLRVYHH